MCKCVWRLLQLLKCVRLNGTVHIYGAMQGGANVTFPVRQQASGCSHEMAYPCLLHCRC
jgi:hypothetical protein